MASLLDKNLRTFISRHIGSVEQLEILCLLASEPFKRWTIEEVFRLIQSNQESVEQRLKTLVGAGFFEGDALDGYHFKPSREDLAISVKELQAAYKESRVKVIEAIYSPSSRAQTFADSFEIKEGE